MDNGDIKDTDQFQSTHSLRSATDLDTLKRLIPAVSIHALLAECDQMGTCLGTVGACFNPRTPCGVRQRGHCDICETYKFQSTHSLRSATRVVVSVKLF